MPRTILREASWSDSKTMAQGGVKPACLASCLAHPIVPTKPFITLASAFEAEIALSCPPKVVSRRNKLDDNWYKSMVRSADFRALPIIYSRAVPYKRLLIKAPRASINFYPQRRKGPRV